MVILSSMVLSGSPSLTAGLALSCRLYAVGGGEESDDFDVAGWFLGPANQKNDLHKNLPVDKKII
ncbi:MAG: hypothetical protein WAU13_15750 [Albidovulum sp.]